MEDKQGDGSSKHLINVEVNNYEVQTISRHGSSVFSSSSDSSQDLINVVENDGNDKPLEKSEQPGPESVAPFRVSFMSSTEQSPPNHVPAGQVPGSYEPNRIPSSIFSSRPATPMDWSTASNESLFSIHVGNNSFSKDQFFMLYKSGELTKFDEQIIAQGGLPPLNKLENMTTMNENVKKGSAATEMPENTTMVVDTSEVAEDHSHQKVSPAEEIHKPIINTTTEDLGAVAENHSQENKFPAEVHNSPTNSISARSDGSNNSTLSFAFPVLGSDVGRSSSVNGEQNNKGSQTESVKQPQKPSTEEVQPQTPVTPQNAAGRSWFSWFYCCRHS
ncbi:PREDICTED: uncharacterized protein LOC18601660 [Theobroma cacao]|uniref:Uncharacterized protein LOC18601660 n=1 Tax=Theobroma cacao TaxID=3641 RepID=A0AB32WAU8_THECC|nr:PREDICTED: uncharacterized protein LOC18601660 [Theobroma cacao]